MYYIVVDPLVCQVLNILGGVCAVVHLHEAEQWVKGCIMSVAQVGGRCAVCESGIGLVQEILKQCCMTVRNQILGQVVVTRYRIPVQVVLKPAVIPLLECEYVIQVKSQIIVTAHVCGYVIDLCVQVV